MVRIATLDGIQPSALKDLNEVMGRLLAGGEQVRKAPLGGVKAAAEMLNLMGTSIETAVLDYIRETDNELAQQIMDNMFTFDDLMQGRRPRHPGAAEGSAVRVARHRAQGRQPELRDEGASRTCRLAPPRRCREELDSRGPVRVSEVEAEQKEMLKIVRRLAEEGQIVIGGGGDDEFV